MVNVNYRSGRKKEYRTVDKLRKEGYNIVQRQAGSHSPFDIIAIHKKDKRILLVQCKPKKFSRNAKIKLEMENSWLCDEFICKYEVR